jgi:hypothetical protein
MASSDQDPEIEKHNAKAFERLLAEALSPPGARTADCPDAETLAAFYERALAPAETAHWRAHFAGCSRCQQALATMAASDPNPLADEEVARLGELVAAASARPVVTARPRTLKWPWYFDPRTLVPLAAAAVFAGALWLAVRSPRVTSPELAVSPPSSTTEPMIAENKPGIPPSLAPPAPAAARRAMQAPAQNAASAMAPPPGAPPASAAIAQSAAASQQAAKETSQSVVVTAAAPAAQAPSSDEASAREANTAGSAAGGAAENSSAGAAGAAAEPSPAAKPGPEQPVATTESVVVQPKGAHVDALASCGSLERAQNQLSELYVVVAKINPQVVWSFGVSGFIERSIDGGRTWTRQSSPTLYSSDFLAGSAPSERVCWLVGNRGAIIRSTDGTTWVRVPSPKQAEQNGQPPDWTFVDARDARSAVIGTKDGRRFSTSDAGKSWQPQ